MLEKWTVAKELAAMGDADTQAALKKAGEEWLRSELPEISNIESDYRSPGQWEMYLDIAKEFNIGTSGIKKRLGEYVRYLNRLISQQEEYNKKLLKVHPNVTDPMEIAEYLPIDHLKLQIMYDEYLDVLKSVE